MAQLQPVRRFDPVDVTIEAASPLEYGVLGGFRLARAGVAVEPGAWERPMAARVVRFLLVHRGFVSEDRLLEAFWPDRDPSAGRRCLAVSVCRCRAVLRQTAIVVQERSYRLALDKRDKLDSEVFEAAAAAALDRPPRPAAIPALTYAAALWTGEPLPEDRYADWTCEWRDALMDRHRELLAALSDAYARVGEHGAALRAARKMLDADPLDEGAHRRVMAGYAALGRRNRALDQFLRCRRQLVDTVGIEPDRQTTSLHARILAGDVAGIAA
jgi:DNA-binding SARP family transcriptional activator